MPFVDIYKITCTTNNKVYIGQTVKVYNNGLKAGYKNRWLAHISDSVSKANRCRKLNCAINKYGKEAFEVTLLLDCEQEFADFHESNFIKIYDSINNGYNLQSGGNKNSKASDETRVLMSKVKIGKTTRPHTDETRKRISETLTSMTPRYGHDNSLLPKYVKYVQWKDRTGYSIVNHPELMSKDKEFCTVKKFDTDTELNAVLDKLKERCMAFYNEL
jgi:group I intron endonuclease